ncbi:GntR family transcriptional regulator [Paraburkholderia ferrariae]|uniref:GntR family transcriptional regulator n=1 Tax=Paraburkholderia ferrariae TaxID=386056 RepID=UPI0005A5D70B|nr:GntR family transcriptional regulator [Paraburkholderia ferrariae]
MSKIELRDSDLPAQIAEETRRLINRGILSPGQQLRQSELAERFDVSRVPVREALNLLTAGGVIVHDPNRGFFVAPLSSSEASQLYRYRFLIEGELFRSIEWPDRSQTAALNAMIVKLDESLENHRRAEWIDGYYSFYGTLFDLSPDKVIRREALRLIRLTDRYRVLATEIRRSDERMKAHLEHKLMTVMRSRDREKLMRVYETERETVMSSILAVLAGRGL